MILISLQWLIYYIGNISNDDSDKNHVGLGNYSNFISCIELLSLTILMIKMLLSPTTLEMVTVSIKALMIVITD